MGPFKKVIFLEYNEIFFNASMQLILYMMFAIRCFLTNTCNCTTLDAAKVDSTFFFKYMLYISQKTDCGVWFVLCFFFYQKFLWMRNIFRLALPKNQIKLLWHFFKNVTQTRLVIIAVILVGCFSICEICDKYTVIRKHDICLGWKPRCHDLSSNL